MPAKCPVTIKELPKILYDLCEFFSYAAPTAFIANIYFGWMKPEGDREKPQWEYDPLSIKLFLYISVALSAIHAGLNLAARHYKAETISDLQTRLEDIKTLQAELVEKIRSLEHAEGILTAATHIQTTINALTEEQLIQYLQVLHTELRHNSLDSLIESGPSVEQEISQAEAAAAPLLISAPEIPPAAKNKGQLITEKLYQVGKIWNNLVLLASRSVPPLIASLTITALIESFDLLPEFYALIIKISSIGISLIPGVVSCVNAFVQDHQTNTVKQQLQEQIREVEQQNAIYIETKRVLVSSTKPMLAALTEKLLTSRPQQTESALLNIEAEESKETAEQSAPSIPSAAERRQYQSLLRLRRKTVYSPFPDVSVLDLSHSQVDTSEIPELAQDSKRYRPCCVLV